MWSSSFRWPALAVLCLSTQACSKPEPPEITPLAASIANVDANGLRLQLRLSARNPNRFALTAQSFTANVVFDESITAGAVTSQTPLELPANVATELDVPMDLSWSGVAALTTLVMQKSEVPFVVKGEVAIGGERLNVKIPYDIAGKVTREQVTGAAISGLLGMGGQLFQGFQQAAQQMNQAAQQAAQPQQPQQPSQQPRGGGKLLLPP